LKTIGLLGGTFDPIHIGHLRLAIEIREALALDEMHLVPASIPNLRDSPSTSADQRLAMLQLAVAGTGLSVDPRELAQSGTSYTVETLHAIRQQRPTESLCFILGQDAFNGLTGWYRWSEILNYAHLVVATRPGYAAPSDPMLIELLARTRADSVATLRAELAGHIVLQPIPLLPIAATDLRRRVRTGHSIALLTPPTVVDYIAQHHLYQR
jgi:nicotinate-nucleotide adenylyltransferase